MMDRLDLLAFRSVYIIREAYETFGNRLAVLSSFGKDSMTLLYLIRKALCGKISIPVIFIDTGCHFHELITFRNKILTEWNIDLLVAKNLYAINSGIDHQSRSACCNARKTLALKELIDLHEISALMLGIRRDEHGIRAKERVFSFRENDMHWSYLDQRPELWDLYFARNEEHIRIHPLLHWTEVEEWEFIKREQIPHVGMYYAIDRKRYRSIGCQPCTEPVSSEAITIDEIIEEIKIRKGTEREGRLQTKEELASMEKLRALGYC